MGIYRGAGRSILILLILLSAPAWAVGATAGPILFSTASDYTDNFRTTVSVTDPSSVGQNTAPGSNGQPGVLRVTNGAAGPATYQALYDVTPASAAVQDTFLSETVQCDFRISAANSSLGLFLRVNAAESEGYLAYVAIDASGTNDRLRIFDSTSPLTTSSGAELFNNGAVSNVLALNTFYTLKFTATNPGDGSVLLDASVYAIGGSVALLSSGPVIDPSSSSPLLSAGEVGLKLNAISGAGNTVDVDNFQVVPEPGGMMILLIALPAAALSLRPRRRRRTARFA